MTERFDLSKYELTFSDEFDGLSLFDGSSGLWKPDHYWGSRNLGNGEQQFYVDPAYKNLGLDPFSIDDGVLTIRAEKASDAVKPLIENMNYTSGMISSEQSFSQQYGYFEIRAEMPAGKGLWPAFWLLTADGEWPPEYDVVEVLGHEPDRLYATSHYNDASGVHRMDHAADVKGLFDSSDGFHTYGFDWQPDTITWYYDGIKVGETANRITDQPMYLIANLTVGGGWPGSPDGSTDFPADMKIDYIRAYQKQSDHAAAGIPTDWAPIEAADFIVMSKDGAVVTWDWEYQMPDSVAKVQLTGDWSRYVVGNDGDNYIAASGAPYNQMDGGKGNDTLAGSSGMDLFVLKDGNGNDVILDFANTVGNTDKVRLEGFHFRHFDDVTPWMSQAGADVVLRLDEDQAVLFKDKQIADFSQEQFVFTDPVTAPVEEDEVPVPAEEDPAPGTGTTTIVVRAAADSWQGDPVFRLLIDGQQVGAETAVTVQKSSGDWQEIAFEVELPADASKIGIQYDNDEWGGTPDTDRNLYIDQVTVGDAVILPTKPAMKRPGTQDFLLSEATDPAPVPPPPPVPETTTIMVRAAADSWQGDPVFRLLIDGQQVGAETAVTVQKSSGHWQDIAFEVELPADASKIGIQYDNDEWGGTPDTDRNLYIDQVTVGDAVILPTKPAMKRPGTQDFLLSEATDPAPVPPPPPVPETTTIMVRAAADSWQGDPLFKLLVDGEQVGADTAVTVQKSGGGWQDIAFDVDLPADASRVAVEFINDEWGGTSDTDRNLYVDSITIGGVEIKAADPVLLRNGAVSFDVPELDAPPVPAPGPDAPQTVTLRVAGEAWNGDPMLRLLVDGEQVGADTAVTARHGSGWQELTFDLPADGELDQFAVQFLNDVYEGEGKNRNLYLDWVKVGDVTLEPEDAWYTRDGLADMQGREKMSWGGTMTFETDHVADWSAAA